MSWNPSFAPGCPDDIGSDSIETLIIPRSRDIGGFKVRRALPAPKRQMVGPFIFFDQAGPAEFVTGKGIDVRPHPHIGLGTVTYLFEGDFHHRDSIGSNQIIRPGEVNWMIAGKGISHSERTSARTRTGPHGLFGIQTWIALPESQEDIQPSFEHHGKGSLPLLKDDGISARLILGSAYGMKAPATQYSEMFYLDISLEPGTLFPLPRDHEDRGLYITQGSVHIAGQKFNKHQMMIFRPGDDITVSAGVDGARFIALGGETLSGPRFIWWNFVSSSKEKIEHAKREWKAGEWDTGLFNLPVDDDKEFVPLPERS